MVDAKRKTRGAEPTFSAAQGSRVIREERGKKKTTIRQAAEEIGK